VNVKYLKGKKSTERLFAVEEEKNPLHSFGINSGMSKRPTILAAYCNVIHLKNKYKCSSFAYYEGITNDKTHLEKNWME